MKPNARISDAEWEVMEILWEEAPLSALAVTTRLVVFQGWKHQTVRTLLSRLVKKGALTYEVEGNRYNYRPAVSREACVGMEGDSFLHRVFGGATPKLVAHFVENAELTPEQLEELRAVLDRRQGGKEKP